jgi:transposase
MLPIKKTLNHPKADKEKRSAFCEEIKKHKDQRRSLVFIDESGFAHDMPRTHGYATKGNRCFGTHDWGAKGRTNVIGALLCGVLLTVSLFQTNVNTLIFNAWVIEDLIPKLPPQSVVIMDNASFHKCELMKKAVEDAGHTLLYLPAYSPDLNPIEKKWAHAKAKRRKVGGSIEKLFKEHVL